MSGINIDEIKRQLESDLSKITSLDGLQELRVKYLGRKGVLAEMTAVIPTIDINQRAAYGQQVNAFKNYLSSLFEEKKKTFVVSQQDSPYTGIDIGLPGIHQDPGRLHPITQTINEICSIFAGMGFLIIEGPEVETEYNNFTGLNIPLEHPSRDAFDTFYLKTDNGANKAKQQRLLLRSQTSPVQIRVMEGKKPPLAVVAPGRVYRPDAVDASHSFMFHQIEGFVVDKQIRFSDLKGALEVFAKGVFGKDIKMRFRPHFFPFTEPSAEVDISCIICAGKGCSVCGRKGWLEILGAGMIHPNVFKNVGYPAGKYKGFAFGMGVERIAMLKYGIDDIRLFFENDLRFLRQF